MPLDFKSKIQFDVDIHPVQNQNRLSALFYHMIDVDHYPEPYEEIKEHNTDTPSNFSCDICDRHFVVRHGSKESFFGYSNYPRCKSTKTIAD